MSKTTSPQRFGEGMDHYYDPNFTADISQKMRVPKRIKVGGSGDDDVTAPTVGPPPDKFEMHVPDRILVAGQEQHIGTRAPPRELILENSVMPPDPGLIRVQTPPRVITLDEYSFPSADDAPTIADREEKFVSLPHPKSKFSADHRLLARGDTPPIGAGGEGLSPAEEVLHLRKQMAKLNRRVMAIELDNLQRQQRKILVCLGTGVLLPQDCSVVISILIGCIECCKFLKCLLEICCFASSPQRSMQESNYFNL